MARCFIDHLTITAPSLEAGAAFVRRALGVAPQQGGQHPTMGTHNLLLRLGDSVYLEVIARDPSAPTPKRPRWFALDTLASQTPPSLATWVLRTANIQHAHARSSEALGTIMPMRRGDLRWHITVPEDGSLRLGGTVPALIEWHSAVHPASTLQDHGLSLAALELIHPEPERLSGLLRSLEVDAPVLVAAAPAGVAPRLLAHLDTPEGRRSLGAA